MFDLALALEKLGFTVEYEGSCTGNDKAAFDALRWSISLRDRPKWDDIKNMDFQPEEKLNFNEVLINEIEALRNGQPKTEQFEKLKERLRR